MTIEVQTVEPRAFYAGDRVRFRKSFGDDYSAADYDLKYYLAKSDQVYVWTASAYQTTDFEIDLPASTTTDYAAGDYKWQARLEHKSVATDKITVGEGSVTILPNLEAAVDRRSHAEKMVTALEAMLESKASKDQMKYALPDGRSLDRLPPGEVTKWLDYYRRRLKEERDAEDRKIGRQPRGRKIVKADMR